MKRLLAVLIVFLCTNTYATNWIDLGKDNTGNLQLFLDIDSVNSYNKKPFFTDDNHVSGFVQFTYIKNHKLRDKGWYYSKVFFIANCEDKTYYSPSFIAYGFKDEVITSDSEKYFSTSDFEMAFPETIGYEIVETICLTHEYYSLYS